ncbi:uncharacterized protein [Diadema antillarum]|uniref:uncharacterized protein n=1 Tax=Diadema antillarum TaxID=105358 RepID=UPI003A8886DD
MATTGASSEEADITEQQRRYNDFVALLQPRTPTFRQNERDALVELVCEYFNVEKNGKLVRLTFRKDNRQVPSGKLAWQEIAARFNSNPNFSKREVQQLRKCWMNMRTRDNFTPGQRLRLGLDQTGKKRRTINSKLRSLSGQIPQIRITKINTGSGVPQVGSIRSRQQQYRRRPPSRAGRPTVSRGPQKVECHQTVTHVYDLTEGVNVPSSQHLVAGGRTDQNHRFVQNRPTARTLDHVRHEQQVHKGRIFGDSSRWYR